MPFSLSNFANTFMLLINKIETLYREIPHAMLFSDDILVYNLTHDTHLGHIHPTLFLRPLRLKSFFVNLKKCSSLQPYVLFLEFIIFVEGMPIKGN